MRLRHSLPILSARFSPDGKVLASLGLDGVLRFWDAASGQPRGRIQLPEEHWGVMSFAFAPDGKRVATAGNDVRLWDIATGKLLRKLSLPEDVAGRRTVAFSPDGRMVASGAYGTVMLWRMPTGKLLRRITAEEADLESLAFSRDGKVLVAVGWGKGSERASVYRFFRWEAATGKEADELQGDWKSHLGKGQRVPLWETVTGTALFVVFAVSPDNTMAAMAEEGMIRLLSLPEKREVRAFPAHGLISCLAFSRDGKVVVAGDDHILRRWEVATGKELPALAGHQTAVSSLAFSADGRIITSAGDGTARRWDAATGKALSVFQSRPARPQGLPLLWYGEVLRESLPHTWSAISPDGRTFVSGASQSAKVRFWDLQTGKQAAEAKEAFGTFGRFTFSADSKVAAWAATLIVPKYSTSTINAWDLVKQRQLFENNMGQVFGGSPALSPDGRRLATAWDRPGSLLLNDTAKGEALWSVQVEEGVYSAAFSPDGRRVAAGTGKGQIRLYAAAKGGEYFRLDGHAKPVTALAFSRDGKLLASGDTDGVLRLWSVATRKEVFKRQGLAGIGCFAFSADGTRLATGMGDGTVLVWELPHLKRDE
jgi:WD40 repeat protein